MVKAHDAAEAARAEGPVGRLEALYATVERTLARAENDNSDKAQRRVLMAVREGRQATELQARMIGELKNQSVQVVTAIEPGLWEVISKILRRYPGAQRGLSVGLHAFADGKGF